MTVVLGLSGSLIVSAVGYSAALFGLVMVAPALEPVIPWLRTRLAGLRRLPY